MRIILASNNPHKMRELHLLLTPVGVGLVTPVQAGIVLDVPEPGPTFAENALLKARAYAAASGLPSVADDSGLAVDVLHGAPGILSARYGGPGLTDADRVQLLLQRLQDVPMDKRTARFVAAIALVYPTGEELTFEEPVEGLITTSPRGTLGFGYDPIFYYPPLGRTFAELDAEEKSAVSHRGRAVRRLASYLAEQGRT